MAQEARGDPQTNNDCWNQTNLPHAIENYPEDRRSLLFRDQVVYQEYARLCFTCVTREWPLGNNTRQVHRITTAAHRCRGIFLKAGVEDWYLQGAG